MTEQTPGELAEELAGIAHRIRSGHGIGTELSPRALAVLLTDAAQMLESVDLGTRAAALLAKVEECRRHARDPIDQNYIAIHRDLWEELEALVRRVRL